MIAEHARTSFVENPVFEWISNPLYFPDVLNAYDFKNMFKCKQEELDLTKYHFNNQEQERADDKQIACLPFGPT